MSELTISFDTPDGFGAIPLDDDRDDRSRAVRRILSSVHNDHAEDYEWQVNFLVELGEFALSKGALLCGVLSQDVRPTSGRATLILSMMPVSAQSIDLSQTTARLDSARAISSVLADRNPHIETRVVQLDSGPAAVAVRSGQYKGSADGHPSAAYGMQIFIPTEDFKAMAIIDLSTPVVRLWHDFVHRTLQFANSITFSTAGTTS